MGLFDIFKSKAEDVDDTQQEDQNIDKIVEYLTDRMSGIDERIDEMENKFGDLNRYESTRTTSLYSELW